MNLIVARFYCGSCWVISASIRLGLLHIALFGSWLLSISSDLFFSLGPGSNASRHTPSPPYIVGLGRRIVPWVSKCGLSRFYYFRISGEFLPNPGMVFVLNTMNYLDYQHMPNLPHDGYEIYRIELKIRVWWISVFRIFCIFNKSLII